MAYLTDGDAELHRCATQHWWARGMDHHGQPMPIVLGWEANRTTLSDRRLSPRSFVDDMTASGISPATSAQIAPLFGRHGAEHRHLRVVLSTAFTPRKVEQLRPAARSIAERLTDAIEAAGGVCDFVAVFAEPLPPEVFAICSASRWRTATGWPGGRPPSPGPSRCGWSRRTSRWWRPPAAEMRAYGHERIAASRAAPGDDLVTRLVQAEVDGERLSENDVIAMITGFVARGRRDHAASAHGGRRCPGGAPGELGAPAS